MGLIIKSQALIIKSINTSDQFYIPVGAGLA